MQTRITTRVIIYYQGKILLCRNWGQDFWYPGGGGLQDNEDLIECCNREVLEETGQKVKILDLMYTGLTHLNLKQPNSQPPLLFKEGVGGG